MAEPTIRPPGVRHRSGGFSVLELLILVAILGVIAAVLAINGRRVLGGQQELSAINTVRQSVWEGATAAASRGTEVELKRNGSTLELYDVGAGGTTPFRTFDLPGSVTTNLPSGQVLRFTPPGRVELSTLSALPSNLTLTANGHTYSFEISVIGEVRVTS